MILSVLVDESELLERGIPFSGRCMLKGLPIKICYVFRFLIQVAVEKGLQQCAVRPAAVDLPPRLAKTSHIG
jgi:hypothetical protein